jgi:hypothetical protein
MNLPNLPTDSLYKFMALTGIVLLLGSLFILYKNIDNQITESKLISIKLLDDTREQYNDLKRMQNQGIKVINDSLKLKALSQLDVQYYNKEEKRADSIYNTLWQLYNNDLKKVSTSVTSFYFSSLLCLMILGYVLTGLGFALWYVRIQRYQDYALIKDIEITNSIKERYKIDTRKVLIYAIIILAILVICLFYITNKLVNE